MELKNGDSERARELLEKAVGLNDQLRLAYVDLGVILTEQKQLQQALEALEHAEKLDPLQPDVHYRLGRLYQAMGKRVEAEKEMAQVKELHEKEEEDLARRMAGEKAP